MKNFRAKHLLVLTLAMLLSTMISFGQSDKPTEVVFKNVKVFDGTTDQLSDATEVLVVGNKIQKIAADASKYASVGATVIDAGGRTITPGLIDAHVH